MIFRRGGEGVTPTRSFRDEVLRINGLLARGTDAENLDGCVSHDEQGAISASFTELEEEVTEFFGGLPVLEGQTTGQREGFEAGQGGLEAGEEAITRAGGTLGKRRGKPVEIGVRSVGQLDTETHCGPLG